MQCQSPLTQCSGIQAATLLKQMALILEKVLVIEPMRLTTILFNEQSYRSLLTAVPNLPS
jgi:hypothetical protein